jgi:tetratricopeptide (TPR) repeat protein
MDGRLTEAVDMAEHLYSRGLEMGTGPASWSYSLYSLGRANIYLGISLEGILPFITSVNIRCFLLAYLGRKEEAIDILDSAVVDRPDVGTIKDEAPGASDVLYLEASVLVGHAEAVKLLLGRLKETGICSAGVLSPTCLQRHLGGAAVLLGRYDEARHHYQEAIRVCTEMRFRPELALSRLQLAELLLDHYPAEKKDALEHLDFAIKEFREMKMQPSLERALRHKEILKA